MALALSAFPSYVTGMSNCSSNCPTQDHDSWGECVRSKGLRVAWAASHNGVDRTKEKKWEKSLSDYREARKQGIQPATTNPRDVRAAVAESERTGVAFKA